MLRSNSLAGNITSVVLSATSLALGTLAAALLLFDRMSSNAVLQSRLSTLADVVGQNSTAALNFSDKSAAVEILQALRREPGVVSACLYDVSESLFADYERLPGILPCAQELKQASPAARKYSNVVRPVYRRNELVGVLSLTSDRQDLEKRQNRLLLIAGTLVVLALGVGGISGSLLQRKVSKPIFDLADAMQRVTAEQKFEARVAPSGSEEIAQLGMGSMRCWRNCNAVMWRRRMQNRNCSTRRARTL